MREHHHHTHQQVLDALRDAAEIINDAQVPVGLREVAFSKAVDLLTAKQIFYTPDEAAPLNSGAAALLGRGMH